MSRLLRGEVMKLAICGQHGAYHVCAPARLGESAERDVPSPHSFTLAASVVSRITEDLARKRTRRARKTWLAVASSARSEDFVLFRNDASGQATSHDRCDFAPSHSSSTSAFPASMISATTAAAAAAAAAATTAATAATTAAATAAPADGAAGDTALASPPPLPPLPPPPPLPPQPPPPPLPKSGADSAEGGICTELMDESHTLTLESIRNTLIRLEDSIIFNLIERAQYKWNQPTYDPNIIPVPPQNVCLLEYLMRETERLQSRVRRFTSRDEHPFFPDAIERPVLPPLVYPKVLCAGSEAVNINPSIWKMYLEWLLPQLAEEGDDRNYGSAAACDVLCLQALSRRIHYGKFVAEAKYREAMAEYDQLIYNKDRKGIMKKLTVKAVEEAVIRRVELKARTFGQDIPLSGAAAPAGDRVPGKIDPQIVARLYGDLIMPLTKEVEVEYLLRRLDFPRTS